ncbi:hypothetical protein C8R46DRAFT_1192436 [Mycena filopes]|nr:hypothetical protein C8R46DRAFT_1192436 [Mycena filopes]
MLSQMPTALSFLSSSSSKGLDGLFGLISIGIQLALTVVLAEFNTEFTAVRATTTVKLVLQPTKCVIFNGTGFHPYVATMGSATLVLLVVCYMLLRAKGTGDGDSASPSSPDKPDTDSGGQPPSPPEDPETASNAKKPRKRWPFLLLIMLATTIFLSLGAALFITCLVPKLRFPGPIQVLVVQTGRAIEGCSAYGSRWTAPIILLATHIFGQQYTRLLILALASHSTCICLGFGLRRLRRYIFSSEGDTWAIPVAGYFMPYTILAAIPQLRWTHWIAYYCICGAEFSTTVHHINRLVSYFEFLRHFNRLDIIMVAGPIIIHLVAMYLGAVFLAVAGARPTVSAMTEFFSLRYNQLFYVYILLGSTAFHIIWNSGACLLLQYSLLAPHIRPLVWRLLFSGTARETLRQAFWILLDRYKTWKSYQVDDFAALVPELRHLLKTGMALCWETWVSLDAKHQIIITTPAIIFYAYFDINRLAGHLVATYGGQKKWERHADSKYDAEEPDEADSAVCISLEAANPA